MSLRYQFLSSSNRSWTSPGFNVGAFVLQHLRKQHHQETHLCMYAEDTAIMNTGISQDQVTNNLNSYLAELVHGILLNTMRPQHPMKIGDKPLVGLGSCPLSRSIITIYSETSLSGHPSVQRKIGRGNALTILLACKESGTSSPEDQGQGASLDIAKRYLHQSSTLGKGELASNSFLTPKHFSAGFYFLYQCDRVNSGFLDDLDKILNLNNRYGVIVATVPIIPAGIMAHKCNRLGILLQIFSDVKSSKQASTVTDQAGHIELPNLCNSNYSLGKQAKVYKCVKFRKGGFIVKQAEEDADYLIIKSALEIAKRSQYVVVVGEDIDLLVIMAAPINSENIFFLKPGRVFLPPTTAAAREQSLLEYLQVQLWSGFTKRPLDWCWKETKHGLFSVTTHKEPVPPALLSMISLQVFKRV
ncbi:hypothetical protein AVEN_117306-1 [Araneus ventricosus]|uniref:Uncharacterized protein n=1 Tax=Araneus ventricosus TaxID=182803 RepID=A0A4Y2HJP7_ARAVE|nr:hypothetical protein AVEN_117306-1 [Araneus ventricosus]